jgi:hypothetical protein
VVFAARFEDPPAVWGVGRIVVDGDVVPWRVSQRDIDDEAAALAPRLAALGLGDGGLVLLVSLLSQAIHVVPFEHAAGLLGARYSSADATPFDAFRTVALVRQLRPAVVLGVDQRVCDGIEALEHELGSVFGAVAVVVAADEDAAARLRRAGLRVARWVRLGPTSAVSTPDDDTLEYDATRWRVEAADDGALLLTNLGPRLTACDRLHTGVRGRVVTPGRLVLDP